MELYQTKLDDILVITPLNFIIFLFAGGITPLVFISIKMVALIKIVAFYKFSQEINKEVLEFADKSKLIYGITIYMAISYLDPWPFST